MVGLTSKGFAVLRFFFGCVVNVVEIDAGNFRHTVERGEGGIGSGAAKTKAAMEAPCVRP